MNILGHILFHSWWPGLYYYRDSFIFPSKRNLRIHSERGISVFTIAYLQVQFIERIIELFSGAKVFKEQRRDRKCKSRKCGGYCGGYIGEIISRMQKRKRRRQIKSLKKGLFLLGNRVTARNDSCILYCWSA
jgi:hypothetical protein